MPIQALCCYQWCEDLLWNEVLGGPAQKFGPGKTEGTLGREEWKWWNEILSIVEFRWYSAMCSHRKKVEQMTWLFLPIQQAAQKNSSAWENREQWSSLFNAGIPEGVIFSLYVYLYTLSLGEFIKSQGFKQHSCPGAQILLTFRPTQPTAYLIGLLGSLIGNSNLICPNSSLECLTLTCPHPSIQESILSGAHYHPFLSFSFILIRPIRKSCQVHFHDMS